MDCCSPMEPKILVKRSYESDKQYLSFHYLPHFCHLCSSKSGVSSLSSEGPSEFDETLRLPFSCKNDDICGSECGGLVYFDDLDGKLVLCNPTTKQFKFLPPPHKESPPNMTSFNASGFGYDHTSHDYKVVRIFWHTYFDEEKFTTSGRKKMVAEVYALKSGCWKKIECPQLPICATTCSYVSGNYYWLVSLLPRFGIISFNFATESFSILPLPTSEIITRDCLYVFVELDDKLGVIGYERPRPGAPKTSIFEIWIIEEGSWVKRYHVALDNVVRPLELKYGLLFIEAKRSGKVSQLLVYNLAAKKFKGLNVYDYPGMMKIFSYNESLYPLPDAKPMDGIYTDDEDTNDEDDDDEDLGD